MCFQQAWLGEGTAGVLLTSSALRGHNNRVLLLVAVRAACMICSIGKSTAGFVLVLLLIPGDKQCVCHMLHVLINCGTGGMKLD
jgi:hypothetical protein